MMRGEVKRARLIAGSDAEDQAIRGKDLCPPLCQGKEKGQGEVKGEGSFAQEPALVV